MIFYAAYIESVLDDDDSDLDDTKAKSKQA